MNPFEMVVLIVGIAMIGSVLKARYKSGQGLKGPSDETLALRRDVTALKERIAVLERLATDDAAPRALEREIEKLRSRDA